ncbi:guanylate-binding protein 1-like [Chanos chanos]|uniref:Guanylate-binding protein 1-like n=1 Tax=Chanos chanos TaxID=29144 RepID=A0A6J2W780_CHACN|nr:guanylate-binding protein 1-like [Chanos chanos]
MPEPICLIDNDTNGHMCVRREALEILEKITQPVVVVAIVGLYRTGKSFLMNKLASKHTGFALGATIESKTKGIWMWCLPHPTKEGHTLVLLDTEGLGDIDKGDEKHDTWIFCLAVLLSSTLVYNSMGTINNDALEKLHYVTELTEHIKVKSGPANYDQSSEFMAIFPSFVWAVRDFTLTLELEGRPITADQYLESALKLKTGSSRKMEEYNQPRRCLREFFSERKCFVFERPTSVEKMKKMEQLADTDLEPNFVKQTQDFCNYIFMNARAKTIREGLGLTGRMLGSLAETYVKAIRSGQVPCLDNAVESLSEIQNRRAINEALDFYKKTMSCKVKLPTETQGQLSDIHAAVEKEAVAIFINGSFNDHDQRHQLEFMKTVQSVYDEYCMKNIEESCQMCRSVISCVFGWLEIAVREGSFMHPGGYKEYCSAMKEATEQYRSEKGHRLMSEEVLKEYLNERDGIGKSILAADRSLTECQRQNELQQLKSEALEQRKRALEEQNSIQQQQMKAQERTYEENIKQLLVKMEQEQQRNQEEHKRVLNAKLKEQSDLLEQGFKGRAESLQKEINDLREDRRRQEESQPSTVSKVLDTVGTAAAIFLPGIGKVAGLGLSLISKWFK